MSETRPGVIEVKWSRSCFCQPRGIEMWGSENIVEQTNGRRGGQFVRLV